MGRLEGSRTKVRRGGGIPDVFQSIYYECLLCSLKHSSLLLTLRCCVMSVEIDHSRNVAETNPNLALVQTQGSIAPANHRLAVMIRRL
jgi:hypothetical protein